MKAIRFIGLVGLVAMGCIEQFPAETQELEDLLVIEGLITDEAKHHEIKLSRVFSFEASEPTPEQGAAVRVVDSQGTEFLFDEVDDGLYRSGTIFRAETGKTYQLYVTTAKGNDFRSQAVTLPEVTPIGEIRAERIFNDQGEEGVGIFVDNSSNGPEPSFFRYEFDETYKIIAPRWEPFRLRVLRYAPCLKNPFDVDIVAWEDERRTCFGTSTSTGLIQASSSNLQDGANTDFRLHFLSRDNYIISHRYSINVIQYAQTQEAYSFSERLQDFSSTPNIFSQVQPGFLEGNIASGSNPDEMVLGYFEVTSVSKKRFYFNYEDLFPNEPLPPYVFDCGIFGNPRLVPFGYTCYGPGDCEVNCDSPLIEQILDERIVFAEEKVGDTISPYYTWPSPCGDCTKVGSNIRPEFWTEE